MDGSVVMEPLTRPHRTPDVMTKLGVASKLDADWEFLTRLRDIGRDRAGQWLDAHSDRLGIESTVDLQAVYM